MPRARPRQPHTLHSDARRPWTTVPRSARTPGPGSGAWPEFALGNVSLYLVDPTQLGQAFTAPHTAHIALRVPDVQAAREVLESRGVIFERDNYDTGVCHMAFFRDPDGNALMLHHRYAPYRDGRLP